MPLIDTLRALPWQKKAMAAGAVVLTVLVMAALARTASRVPMALLYAGLDPLAAGEVVTALDAASVPYTVEGDKIMVPAPERDRLRLTLARDGLPRQSSAGYELLDGLSGFSTTSDMFSAAYWRAKEGELTRTVLGVPGVRAARVHIGAEARSPFARERSPRTASVTVTAPGGLTTGQVKAIQHLTALAVSNMKPTDVAVIDTAAGLLTSPEGETQTAALDERGRAGALEASLVRLLEARVGRGNARVNVAMTLSREREAWTEREMNPDSAVVTARKTTSSDEVETGTEGAVTVASDLPDGDAAEGAAETVSKRGETREEVTYDYARTDRTGERLPGEVTALSVAVLLDTDEETPRTPEEIASLGALVAAAAGLDEARGDRLTIEAMAFERPVLEEAEPASPLTALEPRLWQAGQVAFLGVVALVLGLFVVRPILTARGQEPAAVAELVAQDAPATEDPITALRAAAIEAPEAASALLNAWLEEEAA